VDGRRESERRGEDGEKRESGDRERKEVWWLVGRRVREEGSLYS
jgi:hypothetical protein